MKINHNRIQKAQALMKEQGMLGLMIMNHDDYQFFFGETRVQPRAIIPAFGPPIFICFKAEEGEIRSAVGAEDIKVFTHVGEQMANVKNTFQTIFKDLPLEMVFAEGSRPKVGMQMWFQTPAFLVDLFRTINKRVDLVTSDPVMNELRMVKEEEEFELLAQVQVIAGKGMDRIREMLEPGRTGHELATEATYTMMKAGASGTSTPIHINSGIRSCWIHGKVDQEEIQTGDLVVVDLTPKYRGYCANLARTFVIGKPDEKQQLLIDTYLVMKEASREALKPGLMIGQLDKIGKKICQDNGLGDYHLSGISHGIGLRFEETPAITILPAHRVVKLKENMAMTVGHTILAIPGFGGVRFEDLYRVTPEGGEILVDYPMEYEI
ncbi:MAG: aminopeptidase P family protein [Chloroflexi bacterium]|nr:aminopeptidase P family protein [Chloroflexota bacterium]